MEIRIQIWFSLLFLCFCLCLPACLCMYAWMNVSVCTGWFGVSHYGCSHTGLPEVRVRAAQRSQGSFGNCLIGETFPTWVCTHCTFLGIYFPTKYNCLSCFYLLKLYLCCLHLKLRKIQFLRCQCRYQPIKYVYSNAPVCLLSQKNLMHLFRKSKVAVCYSSASKWRSWSLKWLISLF